MKRKFADMKIGTYFSEDNPRVREVFRKVTDEVAISLMDNNRVYRLACDSFEWLIVEENLNGIHPQSSS